MKPPKSNRLPADEQVTLTIRQILANLIDSPTGIKEMGDYAITPQILPPEMIFERYLLQAMYACERKKEPPTREALLELLSYVDKLKGADLDAKMRNIEIHRTDPPNVILPAYALVNWTEAERAKAALRDGIELLNNEMWSEEVYARIVDGIRMATPNRRHAPIEDAIKVAKSAQAEVLSSADVSRSGRLPGVTLPWGKLEEQFGYIMEGQMASILCRTGGGKTAIAYELAHDIAYNQGDYNVLLCLLETRKEELEKRAMARLYKVPFNTQLKGYYMHNEKRVYLDTDETWLGINAKYNKFLEKVHQHKGRIKYNECFGHTVSQIRTAVVQFIAECVAENRKPVVIIDYHQSIGYPENMTYGGTTDKNNKNADALKLMAQELGIRLIVMVQDKTNPDYSGERPEPYEGSYILHRSQFGVQVRRYPDAENSIYRKDKNGKTMEDYTHKPIYWCEKGQYKHTMDWFVFKANNAAGGITRLWMCNAFFEIALPQPE